MRDGRYWPRQFEELQADAIPRTLINEPMLDNVIALPKPRSLHASLCETLASSRGLLVRLENGVRASPGEAQEVVRELYVATRNQVRALSAALEQDLE